MFVKVKKPPTPNYHGISNGVWTLAIGKVFEIDATRNAPDGNVRLKALHGQLYVVRDWWWPTNYLEEVCPHPVDAF